MLGILKSTVPKIWHNMSFYCFCKRIRHILLINYDVSLFNDFLTEYLLLIALCTYMLAIVESESNNLAEMLKNWRGTEISIEEVGGRTLSCVFPL